MILRIPALMVLALALGLGLSACNGEDGEEVGTEEGAVENGED